MMSESPIFEAERLNQLTEAFKKRSKALKHHSCDVTFAKTESEGFEQLNIDCKKLGFPPTQIRLSLWDDNQMYFRTCKSAKKGWQFLVEFYGNSGKINTAQIVSNFEKSLHLSEQNELMALWNDIDPYKSE